MNNPPRSEITQLLRDWRDGDDNALNRVAPLVEKELRRLAASYLRREPDNHTLHTTALINEAYARLIPQREKDWQNRAHFIAVAAQIMRQILVDYARRRRSLKRNGETIRLSMVQVESPARSGDLELIEVIALDIALTKLADNHPRPARVVEMRFFGGLSEAEVAEILGVATGAVTRDWRFAKAWLYRELA